jgi:hypothetical protein
LFSSTHLGKALSNNGEVSLKILMLLIFLVSTMACSSVPQQTVYDVDLLLTPEHPITSGLTEHKIEQVQLLDNDGNLYVTRWAVTSNEELGFHGVVSACKNKLREYRLFLNTHSIHEYGAEDIKPSLYVNFIKCLSAYGVSLVGKDGFVPESYKLVLSRTHTTRNNYLPVGNQLKIKRRGVQFRDVYMDVKRCDEKLRKVGVEEEYNKSYLRVSIEGYVEQFELCLNKKGYEITYAGKEKHIMTLSKPSIDNEPVQKENGGLVSKVR